MTIVKADGDHLRPPAPVYERGPRPPHLLLRDVLSNPLQVFSQEHFEEPIVVARTPLGERVIVNDSQAIKWILVDNAANYVRDTLQQRIMLRTTGRSLFSAAGGDWRLQRKALAPFFSPKALADYLPGMAAAADDLVRRLVLIGGNGVDLGREMATTTVDVLNRTLFADSLGESPARVAESVRRFAEATGAVGLADLLNLPRWVPSIRRIVDRRAIRDVRARARRLVAAATLGPACEGTRIGMISALAGARDPETGRTLGPREIEDNVSTVIGAGSDTVAIALTWAVFLLSQAPDVRENVEAEADACLAAGGISLETLDRLVWTRAVIEEAMRLYPPAPLIGRMALAADSFGGWQFTAGATMIIAPWVVHRHQRLWAAPDRFDPSRFLPERRASIPRMAYLPFGAGPRSCIGIGYAMQEAVVLLATLARRLRFERIDSRPIELRVRVTLQPREELRMRVVERALPIGRA